MLRLQIPTCILFVYLPWNVECQRTWCSSPQEFIVFIHFLKHGQRIVRTGYPTIWHNCLHHLRLVSTQTHKNFLNICCTVECCSSCRFMDHGQSSCIFSLKFSSDTWMLCNVVVQTTSSLLKLFVLGTCQWSCDSLFWNVWICFDKPLHVLCLLRVQGDWRDLQRQMQCSRGGESVLPYHGKSVKFKSIFSQMMLCLCLFRKVLIASKVALIIYVHSVLKEDIKTT